MGSFFGEGLAADGDAAVGWYRDGGGAFTVHIQVDKPFLNRDACLDMAEVEQFWLEEIGVGRFF